MAKLSNDFVGLVEVCGLLVAFRWLLSILLNLTEILNKGDLQPADRAMGEGPFSVRIKRKNCQFQIRGPGALSGIRELYVRDVYLRNGWLDIQPEDTVVDLGANMGNFTNLALAYGPGVRVISVEPSTALNRVFSDSVGLNAGFLERTKLIRAFVGQEKPTQTELLHSNADYANAEWLSEDEFLRLAGIERIDFLKCDIEGSEFGLLAANSKLLSITKSLACEVHAFAGDVNGFLSDIESCGFVIGPVQRDPDGSVTFLAKRG